VALPPALVPAEAELPPLLALPPMLAPPVALPPGVPRTDPVPPLLAPAPPLGVAPRGPALAVEPPEVEPPEVAATPAPEVPGSDASMLQAIEHTPLVPISSSAKLRPLSANSMRPPELRAPLMGTALQ
jgi:hypothetical protein